MKRFKANQKLLFKAETVFNLRPLEKYEILFSFLDTSPLEILYPSTGRPPIAYGTPKFKKVYNLRSGCERIFSRLLDLCMQNPSVRGLRAISNHCTIAHITVLLVALTAAKTGNKDKIRFVKSFLPNI